MTETGSVIEVVQVKVNKMLHYFIRNVADLTHLVLVSMSVWDVECIECRIMEF